MNFLDHFREIQQWCFATLLDFDKLHTWAGQFTVAVNDWMQSGVSEESDTPVCLKDVWRTAVLLHQQGEVGKTKQRSAERAYEGLV